MRYSVNISFNQNPIMLSKKTETISHKVKTLKEAQQYKTMIDETVCKACIIDLVTGKVVEWWVK